MSRSGRNSIRNIFYSCSVAECRKLADNARRYKPCRSFPHVNNKSMSAQPLSPRPRTGTHFSRFSLPRITVFFKKTQARYLQIFLTFFWQKKITKEMWRNVKSNTTKAVPEFTALPSTLERGPEKFTWRSDNARLRVWFHLYHGLISGISAPDMGNITRWNGAYCRAKK